MNFSFIQQTLLKIAIFINYDSAPYLMIKIIFLPVFFALFLTFNNLQIAYSQNQSPSSQLLPPPKIDNNATSLQNQSGQLQIQTGLQEGEATPLGGLGQQQLSPQAQQQQNQTNGPLEQLGETVGKLAEGK
jgi:hypothetical protein